MISSSSKKFRDFLINLVAVSQFLITLSIIVYYIYIYLNKEEAEWSLTFYRQIKPIQLILGSIFLLWWVARSNDWNSKSLPIDSKIRLTLFQYAILCVYIAFDLIVQNWDNPDIPL